MSEPQQQREDKTTFLHAFKQQIMKAWQPVPTLNSTIIIFSLLSAIFLIFGIVLIAYTQKIVDFSVRYDTKCSSSDIKYPTDQNVLTFVGVHCPVDIEITEDMDGPVFVYYELHNFYQNHRRYVKSKSVNQLQGDSVSSSDLTDCDPIRTYGDLRKYRAVDVKLQSKDYAHPCGLIAASLFNDTYTLTAKGASQSVEISSHDIAWPSDRNTKYKNRDLSTQWLNLENERFMVWMRTAALPNFRKLWGRIDNGLKKGSYTIVIENNYPVDTFDGKKYFVLSTANAFGGRNSFLAISYLVMGIICFLILIVFVVKKFKHNKQKSQKEK